MVKVPEHRPYGRGQRPPTTAEVQAFLELVRRETCGQLDGRAGH